MVAPVANTITSTTSATQDLEVFKNYPTDKILKLLMGKYGSQDQFFQKVQEEGYKEGFESVPKPSFDPNIPINEIGEGTYQKYMGQFIQNQANINPIPQETFGLEESVKGLPTQKPIPMVEDYATTWNQKLDIPDLLAAGKASQNLYNQGALPEVKMTTDTAVDQPSPVPKGDVRKIIESIEQKILKEDDSWSIIKMLKNLRNIKKNIQGGITTVKEAVEPTANELKDEALQLEGKYQTSLVEKIMPTIDKWAQGIQQWGGEMKEKVSSADIFDMDVSGAAGDYKEKLAKHNKRLEAVGMDPVKIPLNLDISERKFKLTDKGERIPLQEPAGKDAAELLRREKLMMEAGKAGADPQAELEKYIANKRESKIAEEKKAKEETENKIFGIDLSWLKKDKDVTEKDTKDVIQEVTETIPTEKKGGITELDKSGRGGTVEEQLEMQMMNVDYLQEKMKKGLEMGERAQMTNDLKEQGVKTKGLTDKNMLLIAMGLGMMASEKPGLQGVGAGALEGLKLVAPLMKEKSSDIQMITVKNDKGENVIVRYNKKKGTYEETGLKSGTQSMGEWDNKIKALAKRSTLYNEEDITNIMIHSMLYSKDKPKAEAIRLTMGLLSSRIPELTKDAEALRKLAEDIVKGNIALDVSASDIGLKT